MTQQYAFNIKCSAHDFDLYKKLWVLLSAQKKNTFSSDDFRAFGLDRFIEDTQHGIGSLFLRWQINKLIEPVGYVCSKMASNHGRRIKLYRMKGLDSALEGST